MPWALSQSIRRFTSAITSGPMPSPGRSRSLWVAMGVSLGVSVFVSRGVLMRWRRIGKQVATAVVPAKAGTHSHRAWFGEERSYARPAHFEDHAVWVPAFA